MLKHLHIENYAIIEDLDMDLYAGLNTITGETGAGKSILLGALGLLAGQKAEATVIGARGESLVVEGEFDISGLGLEGFFEERELDFSPQIAIRRIVSRAGKNRAFVDAQPVTLTLLKELMSRLVDIHSQHETLMVGRGDFQREILDAVASNAALMQSYRQAYATYKDCLRSIERVANNAHKGRERAEYLAYQIEKIELLGLKRGECEELQAEESILSNAAQIGTELSFVVTALEGEDSGAITLAKGAAAALVRASRKMGQLEGLGARVESVCIELRDIAMEVGRIGDGVVENPQRLEFVEGRLSNIYSECKRHGVESGDELFDMLASFKGELSEIDSSDMALDELRQRAQKLEKEARLLSDKLTSSREAVVKKIELRVVEQLSKLGMKSPQFRISITRSEELTQYGGDLVRFLFAGGSGQSLMPLDKVASGGEMSRLMLVIKGLVAHSMKLPTIIFDEIDTGVSGSVADAMGVIIEGMGRDMQVINITHLAQVASKGAHHFLVYKDRGTHIRKLSSEERLEHIASMLSGSEVTTAAREQAKALLGEV